MSADPLRQVRGPGTGEEAAPQVLHKSCEAGQGQKKHRIRINIAVKAGILEAAQNVRDPIALCDSFIEEVALAAMLELCKSFDGDRTIPKHGGRTEIGLSDVSFTILARKSAGKGNSLSHGWAEIVGGVAVGRVVIRYRSSTAR
jgi:hypothetical protein